MIFAVHKEKTITGCFRLQRRADGLHFQCQVLIAVTREGMPFEKYTSWRDVKDDDISVAEFRARHAILLESAAS